MTFNDVKSHFGSVAKAAKAIGMERQSVYRWQDEGIPEMTQYKLHYLTDGKLALDPDLARPA